MDDNSVTEHYLPADLLGRVETRLMATGGTLLAPIYTADEIEALLSLRLSASPIDFCIRNLTHRFPDGPTYFVITQSGAVNAMVARFDGFQCIIVAEGIHVRATVLLVSLLASAPLRAFITTGAEPDEPQSEPFRSREDALARLSENVSPISDEARGLAASIAFLLLYLLAAHEIGHLALGHLDRRVDGSMDEVRDTGEPKAASRAQEWDADSFAMAGTLYLTGSDFRNQPVWCDLLPDVQSCLRVLTVAAYVLFTLMDSMGPQDRPAEERTHPRPLVRAGLATVNLSAVMESFGSVGGSAVMETARTAIRAVEIALHELAGGVMESALAAQLGEECAAELDRLIPVLRDELWPQLDRRRLADLYWARGLAIPPTL